jgi:diguanylate cyclase (GGDEF)-like protein
MAKNEKSHQTNERIAEDLEVRDPDRQGASGIPAENLWCTENAFKRLLSAFVDIAVEESDARTLWEKITAHQERLAERGGPAIGIHTAAYDYFLTRTSLIPDPLLVDRGFYRRIKREALIDGLSGIFNRNYFERMLQQELYRAMRYQKAFSLLLLDIDDFKAINDTKGHLFGDTVIRRVAELLIKTGRGGDIVARYGGDEFVCFLPETPGSGACEFGIRLLASINKDAFFTEYGISVSGGVSEYPYDADTVTDLFRHADEVLYKAKASGKGRMFMNENNRRKYLRYAKSAQILFKPLDGLFREGGAEELSTEDISLGGLSCVLGKNYDPDTEFVFSFPDSPAEEQKTMTVGTIVWRKKIADSRFRYGIKFQPWEGNQAEHLKKLIAG